jgi:hypothetical protein
MSKKTEFAHRAVDMASAMAHLADSLETMEKIYAAREYGTVGVMTDADLAELGITVADFNAILGVIVRFGQFINGQAVTATNNRTIVNKYRTDV